MSETDSPARPRVLFALIFLAHALGAMSLLSVLSMGVLLSADLSLTPVQIGALASVYSAALAAMSLPSGFLTDRAGPREAMTIAGLLIATGLGVSSLANGFGVLALGMLLCGAGYGLINPAAGKAVTQWFRPQWRVTLLGLKQTGVPAGAALGSGIALLGSFWGWQASLLCAAMVALGAGSMFWLFLPAQVRLKIQTRTVRTGWSDLRALSHLGRANLAAGLTNGMQFGLWAHLPEIVQRGHGAGAALLGTCLAALHAGTFIGRIGWGILADKWLNGAPARALRLSCLLALPGCLALGYFPTLLHPFPLVVSSFLLGMTLCAAIGLHIAITAQIAPEHLLGSALGYTMLLTNLGGVAVPLLLGLILLQAGPAASSLTLSSLVLLAIWLVRDIR